MTARDPPELRDRLREREMLDRLLHDARNGRSAVLVVRGEPGSGKSALLRYVERHADGFTVASLSGVESEMELPFAGPPDRFLVALGALTLLDAVAGRHPLLCCVGDAQWLDRESRQVFGFVSRRLLAECVAIVFAVREPNADAELVGLPELPLEGLSEEDARPRTVEWHLRKVFGKLGVSARRQLSAALNESGAGTPHSTVATR